MIAQGECHGASQKFSVRETRYSVYVCLCGAAAGGGETLLTWSQIEDSHPMCINVRILEDAFGQSMGKTDFPQHR